MFTRNIIGCGGEETGQGSFNCVFLFFLVLFYFLEGGTRRKRRDSFFFLFCFLLFVCGGEKNPTHTKVIHIHRKKTTCCYLLVVGDPAHSRGVETR